jgi:hypothetical protein
MKAPAVPSRARRRTLKWRRIFYPSPMRLPQIMSGIIDTSACEFMTKNLHQPHIWTTLTFAGAHFLFMELAWVPLTPLPSHCFDTFALTFRVEHRFLDCGTFQRRPISMKFLVPTPTDFQLAKPKTLARCCEHVIPIFDQHMMASRKPTRISRVSPEVA